MTDISVLSWFFVALVSASHSSVYGDQQAAFNDASDDDVVIEHTYEDIMHLSRMYIERAGYSTASWERPMLCYVPKLRKWRIIFDHIGDHEGNLKLMISDRTSELDSPPEIISNSDKELTCSR